MGFGGFNWFHGDTQKNLRDTQNTTLCDSLRKTFMNLLQTKHATKLYEHVSHIWLKFINAKYKSI